VWTSSYNWWQNSQTSKWRWSSAWCWSQLLLSWWHVEPWWRLLTCHYSQVLYCLWKVQEAPANPDIQVHIPHSMWEGVWHLCPLCSSYGNKTWALTAPDLQRLRQNDRSIIWWIGCVKRHDEISIVLLCARLGIQEVTAAPSVLDGMNMSSDPHPVSSLSPIWRFHVQECEGDPIRHSQIMLRLTWMFAPLVALIHKTELPGDQVLEVIGNCLRTSFPTLLPLSPG